MNRARSQPDTEGHQDPSSRPLLTAPLIALLGAMVHLNALGNAFVYDDHRVIVENLSLRHPSDWHGLLWHDIARPLVNVTYALDFAFWQGPSSIGFHLTSLVIHVVNILLLYHTALALSADQAAARNHPDNRGHAVAGAAALLFAVHPVLTQAIGYVSARTELLCAMFLLMAFNAARGAMRGGTRWLWVVAILSWMCALASKEMAVMFPFALFIYDRLLCPPGGARRRRIWALHVPLISVTLAAAAVRWLMLIKTAQRPESFLRWRFALVELDVFRRYLGLMVVPVGQTIFHVVAPIQSVFEIRAAAGLATAVLFVSAIWHFRRERVVSFGLSWFGLLLLPSALLVVLDRGEPMAEHRLYAASVGFFLAAGWAAALIDDRLRHMSRTARTSIHATAFAIVALLSLRAISRNTVWYRPVALWSEAAEQDPNHWFTWAALGEALHEEGRHEEAIQIFRGSIALLPSQAVAYAKLGQCQLETGQVSDAQQSFARLRVLAPDSAAAPFGLGLVALRVRDSRLARGYFLETFGKDPSNIRMRHALAEAMQDTDPGSALGLCEEIQRLAPQTPEDDECVSRSRERLAAAGVPR